MSDGKTSVMGAPKKEISEVQLRAIMRLKPTLADCAAFFECSTDTIRNRIDEYCPGLTFSQFRDQNMVHTRFSLVRTAIQKAEAGDNCMLIFCLKNLCGWADHQEITHEQAQPFVFAYDQKAIDVEAVEDDDV